MKNSTILRSAEGQPASGQIINTARVHTSVDVAGLAVSDDGQLDIPLTSRFSIGEGTNPEQLFAASWSAHFVEEIKRCALKYDISVPAEISVDAEVDLAKADSSFFFQARLDVHLPGMDYQKANTILTAAYESSPYFKVTRNNVDFEINMVI